MLESPTAINIVLLPCPLGFQEVRDPPTCSCLTWLSVVPGVTCDINTQSIHRPRNVWIGNYSGSLVPRPFFATREKFFPCGKKWSGNETTIQESWSPIITVPLIFARQQTVSHCIDNTNNVLLIGLVFFVGCATKALVWLAVQLAAHLHWHACTLYMRRISVLGGVRTQIAHVYSLLRYNMKKKTHLKRPCL